MVQRGSAFALAAHMFANLVDRTGGDENRYHARALQRPQGTENIPAIDSAVKLKIKNYKVRNRVVEGGDSVFPRMYDDDSVTVSRKYFRLDLRKRGVVLDHQDAFTHMPCL